MTTIKLGVWDVPYEDGGKTTGDIADILEAEYHVMEHFVQMHGQEIVDGFTASMLTGLEDLLSGDAASSEPFLDAQNKTYDLFQTFIDAREMDGLGYPGIPTEAAMKGVNHRLLHPYAKGNPVRPSMKDTGTYMQSFGTEIED
jgi:hypothetical protein